MEIPCFDTAVKTVDRTSSATANSSSSSAVHPPHPPGLRSKFKPTRTNLNPPKIFSLFTTAYIPMANAADSIQVRVYSRRGSNMIHPVSVESPSPAAASPNTGAVEYREVKHFKKWFPWLIPFFVVANTLVFIITMSVNNCPKNSVSCLAGFLGRLSFQPFKENPLLGPSSSA